ncbi:Glycosyltransferase involved in cell wall bisynthesis [Marinobacter sp. es.042]|uniref:glycosyltransferase family 4 protein n=1 Tax=Marinobacter sp. es.042 TaxID=1761794 RepID=UPI000B50E4C9|nr:glycosyltransferase family 4 protein [Marinobacter sp. es.042]SNB54892.1 Glycosyltransferase involved in cell wall bisynthesis [Marinobacter sp. es.042]
MKILYLHQYFVTPEMGGGTRSYELARRMVARGHEVHMVTSSTDGTVPGKAWRHEVINGINVHWLPVPYNNNMSYRDRLKAFFKFASMAGRRAKKIGGDVVFATSTPLTIAIPGVSASKALNVPLVFEVRDLWPELPIAMGALRFPLSIWAAKKLERWAYRNSDYIIGLSPGMCDGVVATGIPVERVKCIPNSCDIDMFNVADVEGLQFRQERPWINERPLVVYAGTIGHINDVEYLVKVAKAAKNNKSDLCFLVVGRGVNERNVRSLATEYGVLDNNFFMEGPMAKSQIVALLSAATVCTSLFIPVKAMENNSANKFFDGLAAGKPVAINYGGWQSEILSQSGAGVEMPSESPEEGASILQDLVRNTAKLNAARVAASELAKTKFSRDALANELIQVLERAYAKKSN